MWHEKYIGIPFKANGRDETGLDCWGLVRLIYEKEFQINLPSFNTDYLIEDNDRIKELISIYKEGWEEISNPEKNSVVLFNILGEPVHIGFLISNSEFIHVRENSDTVVDKLDNFRWKNRIVGFYKYNTEKSVKLTAIPHPLKSEKLVTVVTPGINLEELHSRFLESTGSNNVLLDRVIIMLNSCVIPRERWSTTFLQENDVVTYRALPGKDGIDNLLQDSTIRSLAIIGMYVALSMAAPGISASFGTAGALTLSGKVFVAVGVLAGSILLNAISPIRMPEREDSTSKQQDLINGAANQYNPYGAIPVVLGKIRYTPPLGAKNFLSYPEVRDNYLNMLLIWGYGPLEISDIRVGDVEYTNFQYNNSLPHGGFRIVDQRTSFHDSDFDKIYGNDVDQQYSGVEMIGPSISNMYNGIAEFGNTTYYSQSNVTTVKDLAGSVKIVDLGNIFRTIDPLNDPEAPRAVPPEDVADIIEGNVFTDMDLNYITNDNQLIDVNTYNTDNIFSIDGGGGGGGGGGRWYDVAESLLA